MMKKIIAGTVIICALTMSSHFQARIPTITSDGQFLYLSLINGSYPIIPLDWWLIADCAAGWYTTTLHGAGQYGTPGLHYSPLTRVSLSTSPITASQAPLTTPFVRPRRSRYILGLMAHRTERSIGMTRCFTIHSIIHHKIWI